MSNHPSYRLLGLIFVAALVAAASLRAQAPDPASSQLVPPVTPPHRILPPRMPPQANPLPGASAPVAPPPIGMPLPQAQPQAGPVAPTAAAPAPQASAQPAGEEIIGPIQMRGETLEAVLYQLGRWTGRSIIRPQALPATEGYTLTLPPMPKSEATLALETMLELSGIAVSPLGDHFLKVVPIGQVRMESPEMIDGSTLDLPPSGRVVTKLFRLGFLHVNELKDQVLPLLNQQSFGPPVLFEKTNAVLITDSLSTIQRVERLIQELDKPSTASLQPKFYPLQYAKASDLVNKITALLKPPLSNRLSNTTTVSSDDRTNQIVVISDPRQYPFFDDLIAKFDIRAAPNTRNEVIYLKHATAKDVATLLTNLVSGRNQAASKGDQSGAKPGLYQSANRPTPAAATPATPAAGNAAQAAAANLGVELASDFSSLLTILADDRSNSIVVSGTVDDVRLIREVVDKVDVLLAQVSIQVVIAEVTLTDSDTSGINALNLTVGNDAKGISRVTSFSANSSNTSGGIAGWNITGGTLSPFAFNAALGNNGSKSNVKVLSADTIVTTHNKQAEFVVSQQLPIITGSTSSVGTTTTTNGYTSSSVTYKDIGIDVKVTPLIGDDGSVQLEIDQKVDDKVGEVQVDANTQPIIGHREATSFVTVSDGQIIVLGGLQQTKHSTSNTKLGFLYEIPVISQLLGSRTHEEDRTELLLFVRPHIIQPQETTKDADTSISQLTNKDQVKHYLDDPSKDKKESLFKQLTQ